MSAKELILMHLQKMADDDQNFKQRFEDKDKSIDECMKYIESQARISAIAGVACVPNADVFAWAAHYYQEKNIKIDNVSVSRIPSSVAHVERKQKTSKASCNKAIELDLFGGML